MRMRRTTPARRALLLLGVSLGACTEPTSHEELAAVSWINEAGVPLASVVPIASRADLTPFTTMVGTARLIGLGEATHGTREFFTMKDRLFRHLVQDAGVTGIAMEAPMPEAFGIDTYVRTGVGDPAVLLSHLYAWAWNTQEVADMIAWLRQWNQQHPSKQVGFYGLDVQYPGVAIDSVTSYVGRVMPSLSSAVAAAYSCASTYRNDTHGVFAQKYSPAQHSCQSGIDAAYDLLDEHRTELTSASSGREFELALRMARVVAQWDAMSRSTSGAAVRDEMMAENAGWLLDREGPGGRLVLWAHDYHVSRNLRTMGSHLDDVYHADYLPVGFTFGSGGLNAVEGLGAGALGSLRSFDAPEPIKGSYEAVFNRIDAPNFYFDARQASEDSRAWLAGPLQVRSIGSVYYPTQPDAPWSVVSLPFLYDVLIFIRTTTPSTLLKFQY